MKKFIAVFLMLVSTNLLANPYEWQITRIIDGDTVVISAPWLPDPLKKELSVRIWGVDTPEKGFRAKCSKEDASGKAATSYTQQVLSSAQKIQIQLRDWDKYGGRVLGDVLVDGRSLRELLISKGYARAYYGEAKQNWCD